MLPSMNGVIFIDRGYDLKTRLHKVVKRCLSIIPDPNTCQYWIEHVKISINKCLLEIHSYTEYLLWNIVLEMNTNGKYTKWRVSWVIFHVLRCFTSLFALSRQRTAISNGDYTRYLWKNTSIYCYLTINHFILVFIYDCLSVQSYYLINKEYIITLFWYFLRTC